MRSKKLIEYIRESKGDLLAGYDMIRDMGFRPMVQTLPICERENTLQYRQTLLMWLLCEHVCRSIVENAEQELARYSLFAMTHAGTAVMYAKYAGAYLKKILAEEVRSVKVADVDGGRAIVIMEDNAIDRFVYDPQHDRQALFNYEDYTQRFNVSEQRDAGWDDAFITLLFKNIHSLNKRLCDVVNTKVTVANLIADTAFVEKLINHHVPPSIMREVCALTLNQWQLRYLNAETLPRRLVVNTKKLKKNDAKQMENMFSMSLLDFVRGLQVEDPLTQEDFAKVNDLMQVISVKDHRTPKEIGLGTVLSIKSEYKMEYVELALQFKYQNKRDSLSMCVYLAMELADILKKGKKNNTLYELTHAIGIFYVTSSKKYVLCFVDGKNEWMIFDPETQLVCLQSLFGMMYPNEDFATTSDIICKTVPVYYEFKAYRERCRALELERSLLSFITEVKGDVVVAQSMQQLLQKLNPDLPIVEASDDVEWVLQKVMLKGIMQRALNNVMQARIGEDSCQDEKQAKISQVIVAAALFELLALVDSEYTAAFAAFALAEAVAGRGVSVQFTHLTGTNRHGVTLGNKKIGFYIYDPSRCNVLVEHADFRMNRLKLLPAAGPFTATLSTLISLNDCMLYVGIQSLLLEEVVRLTNLYHSPALLFKYIDIDHVLHEQNLPAADNSVHDVVMRCVKDRVNLVSASHLKVVGREEPGRGQVKDKLRRDIQSMIMHSCETESALIAIYRQGLQVDAANSYHLRSKQKYKNTDYVGAMKDCDMAIYFSPLAKSFLLRAFIRCHLNEWHLALLDCDKAIQCNVFDMIEAQKLKIELCDKLRNCEGMEESASYLIKEGHCTHRNYYLRALARFKLRRFEASLFDCEMAIDLSDERYTYYHLRGRLRYMLDDYEGVIEDLTAIVLIDPENATLYYMLGMSYYELDMNEEAKHQLAIFFAKAASDPEIEIDDIADAHVASGRVAFDLGDYEEAINAINKAMQLMPNTPGLYEEKALMQYNLRQYADSYATCEAGLQLDPNQCGILITMSRIEIRSERYDAAVTMCNKVLERNPEHADALTLLGAAHCKIEMQRYQTNSKPSL